MSQREEDEWEKAEAALSTLNINTEASQPQVDSTPSNEASEEEPLDSAILSALENTRERMALFQIEDIIAKFVQSSDQMMEVPPGLNSFRRLLTHRVAERFGLSRTLSDKTNESGEKGLILYKTSDTRLPQRLVIDLVTQQPPAAETAPVAAAPSPVPVGEAGKKIVVMKRRSDGAGGGMGKGGSAKAQVTAEEKEKAYLEARARIFGLEAGASPPSGQEEQGAQSLSPAPVEGRASPAEVVKSTSTGSLTAQELEEEGGGRRGGKGRVVDVTAWREKKSQVRDAEREKFDPDFVRRSAPSYRGGGGYRQQQNYSQDNYYDASSYSTGPNGIPLAPSLTTPPAPPSAYYSWNPPGRGGEYVYDARYPYGYAYPDPRSNPSPGYQGGSYPSSSDFPPLS